MNRIEYRAWALLALVLVCGCVSPGRFMTPADPPVTGDYALKAAEKVLLGVEHGSAEPVVARWRHSPTVALLGESGENLRHVEKLADELNAILAPAGIRMHLTDRRAGADFLVYFIPRSEFARVAGEYGFRYFNNYPGFFTIWWDGSHRIKRAVVLIDSGLGESRRLHFIYEEITQALGLSNDQSVFRSSIFFEAGRDGGDAVGLGEFDRRLIAFLYRFLRPGDGRDEVRAAFEKHWHETAETA